jgi:hypothetical protein
MSEGPRYCWAPVVAAARAGNQSEDRDPETRSRVVQRVSPLSAAASGWLLALLASASPAAKNSRPTAQKTQPQQALTQAPSTKQSNSKPVAAQRQAAWLGPRRFWASGFWLLPRRPPPKFLGLRRRRQPQQAPTYCFWSTQWPTICLLRPARSQSSTPWILTGIGGFAPN